MSKTKSTWYVPASLILLSIVPAIAGTARLAEVATGADMTSSNARFIAAPLPITIHIVSAVLYSILGAFQFSARFRSRNRGWHRMAGRFLLPFAFLVAISGLWMTLAYPWANNDGVAVYIERLVVGVGMLVSLIMGVNAIRKRKFAEHGDWMIRAYAIALGAGTQVFTHLPWFILVDNTPDELPRAVMMGAGWFINIVVAELIIRRPNLRRAPVFAHSS